MKVSSAATSMLNSLQNEIESINTTVRTQNEAADSYLKTNYEEAAARFKTALLELRGAISVLAQGFSVAQASLQLIEAAA